MRVTAILAFTALISCGQGTVSTRNADVAMNRLSGGITAPAPMTSFGFTAMPPMQIRRSNAEIARDFIDLEFRMESGRRLGIMTRFEGPVTVALAGDVPASTTADLDRLISRFRNEAGLNVSRTAGPANITVNFLPRKVIRRTYAMFSCFVAPRVSSWQEYKAARGSGKLDWTTLQKRERIAIFAPADASPQEVRDCLHEEIAQALGPLNDLYQLPDSVFNDDNFQTVLTGFDMLMLRLHYAPEFRNGMTQLEVEARLPAVLARLNPSGITGMSHQGGRTPPAWIRSMETALGVSGGAASRRAAAEQALSAAHAQGWRDSRLAFSWFAIGRLNIGHDPVKAARAFAEASKIYNSLPGAEIQRAHVDMQLAALALSQAHPDQTVAFADRAIPVARRAQNATLLATLMMLKAEALEAQGQRDAARAIRLEQVLAWARYGFGSDTVTRARMRDISALVPSKLRQAFRG